MTAILRMMNMKSVILFLAALVTAVLSACTASQVKQTASPAPDTAAEPAKRSASSLLNDELPPATETKAGKTLRLMKMMDGGACKNDREGVRGIFLLYADTDAIDSIKKQQGAQVFAGFDEKIQAFSSAALLRAIKNTNFTPDPFAFDLTDAQLKVSRQLLEQFDAAVAPDIEKFQQENGMTIDVKPFFRSLIFYTEGCEIDSGGDNGND